MLSSASNEITIKSHFTAVTTMATTGGTAPRVTLILCLPFVANTKVVCVTVVILTVTETEQTKTTQFHSAATEAEVSGVVSNEQWASFTLG